MPYESVVEDDDMPEDSHSHRGALEPIWGRIREHDNDIRELYKGNSSAHERVTATNEALLHLRDDIREWKDQTYKDSASILAELRTSNERAAKVENHTAEILGKNAGRWEALKVALPVTIGGAGLVIAGLTLLFKFGVIG